jgi:hypothetical protein
MANEKLTAEEKERYRQARAEGRAIMKNPAWALGAQYDFVHDSVEISFRSGASISIPRRIIPAFANDRPTGGVTLLDGETLECEAQDIQIFIPGLIEEIFGPRVFAAAAGRRAGMKKSETKAEAARINGRKGGRPRKNAA